MDNTEYLVFAARQEGSNYHDMEIRRLSFEYQIDGYIEDKKANGFKHFIIAEVKERRDY